MNVVTLCSSGHDKTLMFDKPASEAYPSETPNGLAPAFPTNIGLERSTLAYDAAVLFSSVKALYSAGHW